MRKLLRFTWLVACLLLTGIAIAQDRTVTGRVSGDDNKPLPGVTISVKGTPRKVVSDANGNFSIVARTGDVLQFSSVGRKSSEIVLQNTNTVDLIMNNKDNMMSEVVVTAMDQRRNPRELGYSVQTVKGADIAQTQRENFVNALQGRVAGLTITPTTGAAGASSGIILRGFNTLSGTNQPLFVVDGVIADNSTLNSNSQGGAGIGLASDLPNRNNDYTNRIADINPNDIESITVLKGPEATALYGSQAGNGAIVITTKKAKSTAGRVLVSYDNNFRFQKITRFAELNNEYGPGTSNGIPFAPTATATGQFTSFGPAWRAGTKLYDNVHNFFRTGFSQTHNLGLEFGTKNVGFRVSGQYFDSKGVLPNNTYNRYNLKISNTTKIGKFLSISPSVAYINTKNIKPLKGTSGSGGYLMDLYAWPANFDIRNYQDANGLKLATFSQGNFNLDYDNPIWSAYNNSSGDKTQRLISTLGIDLTPLSWLTLAGRFGYDTYKTDGYLFEHPQSFVLTSSQGGLLDNYYRKYMGYNHTITATAKKKVGDFSLRLLGGTMWQDYETQQFGIVGTRLVDSTSYIAAPGSLYKNGTSVANNFNPWDSSITLPITRTRLLRNAFGLPNLSILREIAYFGEASVGFKDVVFLTYSHRWEKASPIPSANNNYHYPGASLSVILSDIFPKQLKGYALNFWKLRGSLANTARLNDPYTNQRVFVNNLSSSVVPAYTYGFTSTNPYLTPERQKTYEIGTELRMWNSLLTLEAAYYNTLCTDQIVQGFRASYATGSVLNTANAASLRNEGVEVTLNINPVQTRDLSWNITANFNNMWSKVLSLPSSIGEKNDFYNSDTYISNVRGGLVRGRSTGTITGSLYTRSDNGQILINPANGLPLVTAGNFIIGDRTPNFTLGLNNSVRWRNFSLSVLVDFRQGGDIYNGTDQVLTGLGRSARTADRNTPILIKGVLNDGLQNTSNPTQNTIAIQPYFLSQYYTTLPDEEFVEKGIDWIRLRDVTLSYRLADRLSKSLHGLSNLSVFVTGNDLFLISNYHGADPAVNSNNPGTSGVGGYGLDLGSAPTPVSFSFGLRANF